MVQIDINDADTLNLVQDAISSKVADTKAELQTLANEAPMNMVSITTTVNNINNLEQVIEQINVKKGFMGGNDNEG